MANLDNTFNLKLSYMSERGTRSRWMSAGELSKWTLNTTNHYNLEISKAKRSCLINVPDERGKCVVYHHAPYRVRWINFNDDLQDAIRFCVAVIQTDWETAVAGLEAAAA